MPTLYRYGTEQTGYGGIGTSRAVMTIRAAVKAGGITTKPYTMKEGDRLDIIAHKEYGDGRLWWIIAAASNIGWWAQLPPGTHLKIPTNIFQVGQMI
tara:strand:+ start:127 stop:417 length:291 start_codon:yes stop_codon:yes gene_type:complete